MTMAMASLLAEKDVLAKLKADSGVTAATLVPAAQIYPQDPVGEPVWPFIVPTRPQGLPINAACVRGATVNFGLSAFTRGRPNLETARDHAARIGDAIETVLNGAKSTLAGGVLVKYTIGDMLLRVDGAESGAFHYSCSVRARVLGERTAG